MILYHTHADPPLTLVARLWQLRDTLLGIGARVRAAVASAVSLAAGEAIRDGLCLLLAGKVQSLCESKIKEYTDQDYQERAYEFEEYPWDEESLDPVVAVPPREDACRPSHPEMNTQARREGQRQPGSWSARRPILWTALVVAGACVVGTFGGATVPALISILAVAGTLITNAD